MPSLPAAALMTGSIALIWLACTVTALCGLLIGTLIVRVVYLLGHPCLRLIRHRRGFEYAQLVTVDSDGAHAQVVNLDRYRKRRRTRGSSPDAPRCFDDGPA